MVVDRNHGFNGLQVMGLYIGLRGSEVEGSEEQGGGYCSSLPVDRHSISGGSQGSEDNLVSVR